MSCSGTLRHAQGGIEPATLRLPDDSSYLLSYIVSQEALIRYVQCPGANADPRDLRSPGSTVGLAGVGQQSSEVLGVQNSREAGGMAGDVNGVPGGGTEHT